MAELRIAKGIVRERDFDALRRLLPSNYRIASVRHLPGRMPEDAVSVTIVGRDVAGWTLDLYVIPRLASGLIFFNEFDHALVGLGRCKCGWEGDTFVQHLADMEKAYS